MEWLQNEGKYTNIQSMTMGQTNPILCGNEVMAKLETIRIYNFIGPTSTSEGLPTTWENRGLERLEVKQAGGVPVCA